MSEWISVKNKLPPLKKYILANCDNQLLPTIVRRLGTKKNPIYQGYCCLNFKEVTHWMPLPTPPEVKNE